MDLNPQLFEGRQHGVIPLMGGVDQTTSKFLAAPGTLRDCLNYEVESSGYTRSSGLMLYNGAFDDGVKNALVLHTTDAPGITGLDPDPGALITWTSSAGEAGSATCVYADTTGDTYLWLADVEGSDPLDATVLYWYSFGGIFQSNLSTTSAQTDNLLDLQVGGNYYVTSPEDYVTKIKAANAWLAAAAADGTYGYWQPSPPGLGPISGGFQFADDVYVVRDFWGIGFDNGSSDAVVDDTFIGRSFTCATGSSGTFSGVVAELVVESGSWSGGNAAGVIYCEPGIDSLSQTMDSSVYEDITDNGAITMASGGGLSDTTTLTVDLAANKNKGWLWKASRHGWSFVDPGWHARFRDGTNAPNATVGPLFLQQRDASSAVGSNDTTNGVPVQETGGGRVAWTGIGNIKNDDATTATVALLLDETSGTVVVPVSTTDAIPHGDVEITGFEVVMNAWAGTATTSVLRNVKIRNAATGKEYMSDNESSDQYLSTSASAQVTVGGQFDDWGIADISKEDFESGDIEFQFEAKAIGGADTVTVDHAFLRVHYIIRGQRLYGSVYDTPSGLHQDIGHVDLLSLDVHTGFWANDDVTGYMNFSDLELSSSGTYGFYSFWGGRQPIRLYTEPVAASASPSGDFVAELVGGVHRNLLPSYAELQAEESQWESIQASFYVNNEGESVYAVNGAGPAIFLDNKDRLAQIFLPIPRAKDKPRHVAYHANSLCLGLSTGHLLVSNPEAPNDFDVTGAASTHSFRDPIYGLQSLSGNALGVFCRESINALIGTSAVAGAPDPYRTQHLVPNSGIVEYSLIDAAIPLYCDYQGINTLSTSDKFGNFEAGRLSERVESWMRRRLQRRRGDLPDQVGVAGAVPVRSKNQYRVFFKDGYVANMFLGTLEQPPQITFMHYDTSAYGTDFVPTWIDSSVLPDGRERVLIGTADGRVWLVDAGNALVDESGTTTLDAWVETNPTNSGNPQGATKTLGMVVMADIFGGLDITTSFGRDYLPASAPTSLKELGDKDRLDRRPDLLPTPDYTDVYTDVFTDGISIKIKTELNGSLPHTLQTLLHRFSYKGQRKNNTQVSR